MVGGGGAFVTFRILICATEASVDQGWEPGREGGVQFGAHEFVASVRSRARRGGGAAVTGVQRVSRAPSSRQIGERHAHPAAGASPPPKLLK